MALVDAIADWPNARATWREVCASWLLAADELIPDADCRTVVLVERRHVARDEAALIREFVETLHALEDALERVDAGGRRSYVQLERAVHSLSFGRRMLRDTTLRARIRRAYGKREAD